MGKAWVLNVLLLLITSAALAQQEAYESPAGTKFILYTPPGYSSDPSAFPLLLSLHSKGEVSNDITELTSKNPEQMPCRLIYLNRWPAELPFIVLTPQLKPDPADPEIQWSAEYIDEVVRYVIANFRIDLNRIYVTGISRGGTGTWTYASAYPEKVAAIVALSGRSDPAQACPIKDIPIWAFHGESDNVAPTHYSIDIVNAIRNCQPSGRFKPRLNILHARNHDGWNEVYNGSSGYKIFEWLLQFRKNDTSNKAPYVNAGKDLRLQLRSTPLHIMGDFFDSDGEIAMVTWRQTSGVALTLGGTGSALLRISNLKTGIFEFELTVTDNNGAQRTDKVVIEITNNSVGPAITELVLVDGKTNVEIGPLTEGQIINKRTLGLSEINIKAIANDGTLSIIFNVNTNQNTRTQNSPGPYFLKNQTSSPEWGIANGEYLIYATPYPQTGARGNPGITQSFTFTVTDEAVSQTCAGAGKIGHEVWTGISGTQISSIPVNEAPSSTRDLTLFEGPSNIGDNYGSRIRGYICPPSSGSYTFWVSSNDNSELWLSTDENPANKKRIAFVTGYTNVREWGKYSSQQSAPVNLVANQRYYIEALQKEGVGTDHLAVGWQLPGGSLERPIPGMRLIPFQASANSAPVVSITSPDNGQQYSAPASVNISASASVSEGSITKVEFYNGTAKLGEDATSPYTYSWSNVGAGTYSLVAKALSGTGTSASATVSITVSSGSSACAGTGTILRELWTGIQYNDVGSIPLTSSPDQTSQLTIFQDPANSGDNYGTRVSGYLCVPISGGYTFWIASNDHSELWLSTDADPFNKRKIAYVTGYTNPLQWTKFGSQQSSSIQLVAGQRYYIEALHKEGVGSDHMAVGWQLPNGAFERPIPGNRLSPYGTQPASADMMMATNFTAMGGENLTTADTDGGETESINSDVEIFPNPLQSGTRELTISGYGGTGEARETTIEIMRMTGEVVFGRTIACETNCQDNLININKELEAGVYLIRVNTNGKRYLKRLLVK